VRKKRKRWNHKFKKIRKKTTRMHKKRRKKLGFSFRLLFIAVILSLVMPASAWDFANELKTSIWHLIDFSPVHVSNSELAELEYNGVDQVMVVNHNMAEFTEEELSLNDGSWQTFSDLDGYNRVGVANAMLSQTLMPSEPRESLYVNPTGWKNKQITRGDVTNWLYNRCHLIGFQLTGENNNLKNLMTGTRSLNTPHMLQYENKVASYIKETNHHVRYRVEPIFRDNELVARGIHMQAQSIEDDQINFNIYIFNIEEGVIIDYTDGSSKTVTK